MTGHDSPGVEGQVAIVGMAGRFPGAPDLDAYWDMVAEGRSAVRDLTDAELRRAGVDEAWLAHPDYVKAAAVLDDVDRFDAPFFDMSPREAAVLDPQHRLFLQTCWHALEHAGLMTPGGAPSHVGVFGGAGGVMAGYLPEVLGSGGRLPDPTASLEHLGVDKDFLATRVSYKLNLTGPALTVQTACSTSMVAVHMACQSLLNGECAVALAGGATVRVPTAAGYFHRDGGILSPEGRCLPFDERASGTLFGSGVGAVVLKPLEDALRDGDTVYATVLGTAVNNDGGDKASYGASSLPGQLGAMRQALAVSGVDPAGIGYVEAHGTGVAMGDPVELAALGRALGRDGSRAVGSVKALVGHLEAAAGVAGLIKTTLALHHGVLPPSPYFERPNPRLRLEDSGFYVNREPLEWTAAPRRAAVNSLGIGGTNAFAVLQEAPAAAGQRAAAVPQPAAELMTVSARTAEGLRELARDWAARLREPGADLRALAYTGQVGRRRFAHRVGVTAATAERAAERLESWLSGGTAPLHQDTAPADRPRIAFLYSGQGSQYPGMALDLYRDNPLFRAAVDRHAPAFEGLTGTDPLKVLADAEPLGRAELLQPVFFLVQVALTELWDGLGIRPAAVIGHSLGEFAAACAAGVLDVADAMRLVTARGQAVAELPDAGRMIAVGGADSAEVERLVAAHGGQVTVAAYNAPGRVTVSGATDAITALEGEFAARGWHTTALDTTHAFHSPLMDPATERLRAAARDIAHGAPRLPFVTNVSGAPAGDTEIGPDYWPRQLTAPVRFSHGVAALLGSGLTHFVEIGPSGTLAALGRLQAGGPPDRWMTSLARKQPDTTALLTALARLDADGAAVDWPAYYRPYGRGRVPAPLYPFARHRYWADRDGTRGSQPEPARTADAVPPGVRSGASAGALPGALPALRRLALPGSSERRFETSVSTATLPSLDDHVIMDRPVVPGAYHTACMLEAVTGRAGAVVTDLVFPRALVADGDDHSLQIVAGPDEDGWSPVRVLGLDGGSGGPYDEDSWHVHAEGRIAALDTAAPSAAPPPRPREPHVPQDVDRLYAALRADGFRFGPAFRWIERLSVIGRETVAAVALAAPTAREREMAVLDASVQTAIAAVLVESGGSFEGRVLLPFRVARATLRPALGDHDSGRVRVVPRLVDDQRAVVDVWLEDEEGRPRLDLLGLELRFLTRSQLTGVRPEGLVHVGTWEEFPAPAPARLDGATWIVLGDPRGYAKHLVDRVRARGAHCTAVEPGTDFVRHDEGHVTLDPADPDQLAQLFRESGPAHLVHCLAPDGGRYDEAGLRTLCGSVPAALRAAELTDGQLLSLTLVTSGAVAVAGPAEVSDPHPSALWGLGRTVSLELPELAVGLCEVDPTDPAGSLALLGAALGTPGLPGETAVRGGRWYRGGLRRAAVTGRGDGVRSSGQGCYLVTGGLGALGLRAAAWLAGRGVRHVVLASRSAPGPAAAAAVAGLEASGLRVTVAALDVTDEAAVEELVARAEREWGGLRGVVHAAGVIDDAAVSRLGWESFADVMAPKIAGTWHLHRATLGCALEQFVLFSSTAAFLGSPGQAHYAAANAFLDGFAHYRGALRLPALSVGWGPWGIGMADRLAPRLRARLTAAGYTPLDPEPAFEALDQALAGGYAHCGVLQVDWTRYRERYPQGRAVAASPAVVGGVSSPAEGASAPSCESAAQALRRDWQFATDEQRAAGVTTYLRQMLAARLGMPETEIDPDVSLTALGLDSLLAVEVRGTIRRDLAIDLPLAGLLDADAFQNLADALLDRLRGGAPTARAPRESPAPRSDTGEAHHTDRTSDTGGASGTGALSPAEAERLLAALDTLSEAEIRALEESLEKSLEESPDESPARGDRGAEES